jgi:hypothetical protein
MKQTVVEWLEKELSEYLYFQLISSENKDKRNVPIDTLRLNGMFDKAKEMEKQQLKEMYLKGIENYDPTFTRKS